MHPSSTRTTIVTPMAKGFFMRVFCCFIVLSLIGAPAHAATLNSAFQTVSVSARCGGTQRSDTDVLSANATSRTASASGVEEGRTPCTASAFASAGGGVLRTSASIENTGGDEDTTLQSGGASAGASLVYQLQIASTSNAPSNELVPFSINLSASGAVSATSQILLDPETEQFLNPGQVISSSLRLGYSLGRIQGGGTESSEEIISARVNPGESQNISLQGDDLKTGTIMVRDGDSVSFSFFLNSSASGQLDGKGGFSRSSATRSFSFATDRPVFDLPEGFTVLINEPRIVNNRYTPPPLEVIPVPGAIWLFLTGAAPFALRWIRTNRMTPKVESISLSQVAGRMSWSRRFVHIPVRAAA